MLLNTSPVVYPSGVNTFDSIPNLGSIPELVPCFRFEPGHSDTRLIPEVPKKTGRVVAHLDYLRFTATVADLSELQNLCRFVFWENYQLGLDDGWSSGKGAVRYENSISGDFGGRGGWRFRLEREDGTVAELDGGLPVGDNIPIDLMIDLPGDYFRSLDSVGTWRLLRGLHSAFGVRCSRIDLAIDDYGFEYIPLDEMVRQTKQGNNMFFCKYKKIESYDTRSKKENDTHYFGSRESGKMVRVYEHRFEDGLTKSLRMETEFKRGYAVKIFDALAKIERVEGSGNEMEVQFQKIVCNYIVGSIDFRDKSKREQRSKASVKDCPRLSFWDKFVREVGGAIRVKLDKVVKTVEKSIQWLKRSVAPTLSALYESLPSIDRIEFISKLVAIGADRGGQIHKLIKKIGKNEPDRMKLALCR